MKRPRTGGWLRLLSFALALGAGGVLVTGCDDKNLGSVGGPTPDGGGPRTSPTSMSCPGGTARTIDGQPTGFSDCAGILHRPSALRCPNKLPRSQIPHPQPGPNVTESCKTDAECVARPNGYCRYESNFAGAAWFCDYGCLADADCGAGSICLCGDPVGTCVVAACKADTDCASGKLCAGGAGVSSCAPQFACQTAADRCQSRTDCAQGGPNPMYCAVSSEGRRCMPVPADSGCF